MGGIGTPVHEVDEETLDALLWALSDHRRRKLLRTLRRQPEREWPLDDVIASLAEPAGTESRQQLHVLLRHVHLPKLDEHGLVDYDAGRGVVVYRSHDVAEALLEHLAAYE